MCVTCFGKFLSLHCYQIESYSKNKICHVTECDVTNRSIANIWRMAQIHNLAQAFLRLKRGQGGRNAFMFCTGRNSAEFYFYISQFQLTCLIYICFVFDFNRWFILWMSYEDVYKLKGERLANILCMLCVTFGMQEVSEVFMLVCQPLTLKLSLLLLLVYLFGTFCWEELVRNSYLMENIIQKDIRMMYC